jgi:hypothetical protein
MQFLPENSRAVLTGRPIVGLHVRFVKAAAVNEILHARASA